MLEKTSHFENAFLNYFEFDFSKMVTKILYLKLNSFYKKVYSYKHKDDSKPLFL